MDYHYQSVSNVKITKLLLVCKSGTAMDNKSQCVFYNWYLMFRLTWYSRCLVLRVKGKSSWHSKSVLNNPSPFFALKVVAHCFIGDGHIRCACKNFVDKLFTDRFCMFASVMYICHESVHGEAWVNRPPETFGVCEIHLVFIHENVEPNFRARIILYFLSQFSGKFAHF